MKDNKSISDLLPLTEATFFILLSLATKPKHGYAIMKDVQALSDGRVILSTGTLYGAIKRLLNFGWIHPLEVKQETQASNRERKAYRLTNIGNRILHSEIARLENLTAKAKLRTRGAES